MPSQCSSCPQSTPCQHQLVAVHHGRGAARDAAPADQARELGCRVLGDAARELAMGLGGNAHSVAWGKGALAAQHTDGQQAGAG